MELDDVEAARLAAAEKAAAEKTAAKRIDQKFLQKRADDLLAGMRQGAEGGAEQQAILASPMGYGANGPGTTWAGLSRGAAATPRVPRGLAAQMAVAEDLKGQEALHQGAAKLRMRDYPAAENIFNRRLNDNPNDAGALFGRALARRYQGHIKESAEDAQQVLQIRSGDTGAMKLLSRDLIELGRHDEAIAQATHAVDAKPDDAEAYQVRAQAYAAKGDAEAELADLARAAELDPTFRESYRAALKEHGREPDAAALSRPSFGRPSAVWMGAIGISLFLFGFALLRRRGESELMAMRQEDHEVLERVVPAAAAGPVALPKGFRVLKTLGQGGMGVVFEALDLGLQRTVAIKKLRPEVAEAPRERARFLKEARTVAALKHPNVVEIHSIHEDAEGLFLVFERVPGETLHERLGRGPMPAADAVAILRQVASALDYAHTQGVVHQDLKPANVMVNMRHAKVMDFGIARRVQETLSTLSRREVAGTPAYMAPEQESGVATAASDVFALGVCAYETLCGSLPYPTGGVMMKIQKHYRKPSEFDPRYKAADAVIERALEPRAEARWPTATAFVDALAQALS